jgi:hypothetical protein
MRQKGVAIRSTLQAVANLYGEASLARVKGALPEAVRAQIEPRVLPVAWYPIEVSAAIHEAIRDALGDGNWEISHTIGIEAARIDFTGIYRVFLRSMQYDTMWDRAQRAWTNYNSQGETRWVDREPGHAVAVVAGVSGFNLGIWEAVAGRLEGLLQMSGAKGATVEVKESSSTDGRLLAMWLE